MPKFTFSLQALLDQRLHVEREKQHAVAHCEFERVGLESEIAAKQHTIGAMKDDIRSLLSGGEPGGVDLRTVRMQAAASFQGQMETQRLALKLAGIYSRLEAARVQLQIASTRRRAVELLKQKQYDEWKREINRKENLELDEIGTLRAARLAHE